MSTMIDPKIAPNVQSLFPEEKIDFAVKAKRKIPLIFGIFRLLASFVILSIILSLGGTVTGYIFNPPGPDQGNRYILIAVFALLLVFGIISLIDALRVLFWDPVYFVGTDKRIAMLGKKNMYSRSWDKIYTNVLKFGSGKKGSIMLMPKPGITGKDSNAMLMSGVANCDAIQEACKKRIMEASIAATT